MITIFCECELTYSWKQSYIW